MNTNIPITVRERVPTVPEEYSVISHNTDYTVTFDFDGDWTAKYKTVYFVGESGEYTPVVMEGNTCAVPEVKGDCRYLFIGVQEGTAEKPGVLKTSRACCLKIRDSITDMIGAPIPYPEPSVYEQIIAMLEKITVPTWSDVKNKPFSAIGDGLSVDEAGVLSAQGGSGGTPNAVKYVAQTLTDEQKAQARTNIGAGTSSFSGSYNDLTDKPTIPEGYTVDSELSATSKNAVQNKVITAALNDKIQKPSTAQIGQLLKVKSVDANGKITEVEAADVQGVSGTSAGHWQTILDTTFVAHEIHPLSFDTETSLFTATEEELADLEIDTVACYWQVPIESGVAYADYLVNSNGYIEVTKKSATTFSVSSVQTTCVPTKFRLSRCSWLFIDNINSKKVRITMRGSFNPTFTQYDSSFILTKTFGCMNVGYAQLRKPVMAYEVQEIEMIAPREAVGYVNTSFYGATSNSAQYHGKYISQNSALIPHKTVDSRLLTADGTKISKLYSSSIFWLGNSTGAWGTEKKAFTNGDYIRVEKWVESEEETTT